MSALFKMLHGVKRITWYILLIELLTVWLLCGCYQKDLCYNHNHASDVTVRFDWRYAPDANPASMFLYLLPKQSDELVLKREYIGKDGGVAQALVGIEYAALGFNSDVSNTLFQRASDSCFIASSKDASVIGRIGIAASELPRVEEAEKQRKAMEVDSLWTAYLSDGVYVSLDDNDNGISPMLVLYPQRIFCTYRVTVLHVDNQDKISSSIAGAMSGLAGGINLMDGSKTSEVVTVPFAVSFASNQSLEATFRCYGNSPVSGIPNKFVIYTVLKDGSKWCYVYDVTEQVMNAPNPYEVEILLDKLPVPSKIDGNCGLKPGVSDWNVIEIPVKM